MLYECPQHLQEELFPFVSSGTALLRAAVKSSARACLLPPALGRLPLTEEDLCPSLLGRLVVRCFAEVI